MKFISYLLLITSSLFSVYNVYLSDSGLISYLNVCVNNVVIFIIALSGLICLIREEKENGRRKNL